MGKEMSKYQWPASRLAEKEMEILFLMRGKTKQSICELLREAVHIAYNSSVNFHNSAIGSNKRGISNDDTRTL